MSYEGVELCKNWEEGRDRVGRQLGSLESECSPGSLGSGEEEARLSDEKKLDGPGEPSKGRVGQERTLDETAAKYRRGSRPSLRGVTNKKTKHLLEVTERKYAEAVRNAARAEVLLSDERGCLEAESELEATWKVKQSDIQKQSSLASSHKVFHLRLETYAPYTLSYSRSGRYVLLGGEKGHVVMFDWYKSELMCELELKESVYDVQFLHNETMFAVAQRKHVYIYDKKGVELHCLKSQEWVRSLSYLPYHFLLVSVGKDGVLRYQDTSTGALVATKRTRLGCCTCIRQNPANAVIHLGHQNGVVTMWTPSEEEPLVKMLCHRGPVLDIAIDVMGRYMVTSGEDKVVNVWSLASKSEGGYEKICCYVMREAARRLSLSQTGLLGLARRSCVEVWKDFVDRGATSHWSKVYMRYRVSREVRDIEFCAFEDVLGIGHGGGFSSIVVPGAGEANLDTYEENPYETKKQRREMTVHRLLEKIQPEMISIDSNVIGTFGNFSRQQLESVKRLVRETPVQGSELEPKRSGEKIVVSREETQEKNRLKLIELRKQKQLQRQKEDMEYEKWLESPRPALDRFLKKST
ncbi:uncharacterized protein LOC126332789 [Schistocerca gregaria]|uniref:uncharacterized protein LOC126332789 n=1 Tax=Schistocerca gregaria TaxID=7010 RepID=UPI00211E5A69|nr:uncharacterized protein LOC126332789 [Schistocerca gregaria]